LHSIINFIVLIILLILANVLVSSINNSTYSQIILFLNSLLGLFIALFLIGMINRLFWNFDFPLNLLAPISGGILGVLIVDLVSKILGFTQTFVYFDIINQIFQYPISTIVFFATIIIGYLIIINEETRRKEEIYPREEKSPREERKEKEEEKKEQFEKEIKEKEIREKVKEKNTSKESNPSWRDVEDEFKKVSLNIGKALNKPFKDKDKDKKKKPVRKTKKKKAKIRK